jgi:hypothetical protein
MAKNKFENMFTDTISWKWTDNNCYPNRRYYNKQQRVGAVAVVRKHDNRGDDFALNSAGLDYVVQAETDGRIKEAWVILAVQNGYAQRRSWRVRARRRLPSDCAMFPSERGSGDHTGGSIRTSCRR